MVEAGARTAILAGDVVMSTAYNVPASAPKRQAPQRSPIGTALYDLDYWAIRKELAEQGSALAEKPSRTLSIKSRSKDYAFHIWLMVRAAARRSRARNRTRRSKSAELPANGGSGAGAIVLDAIRQRAERRFVGRPQ